ncbi:MAG: hypothetical protein J6U11_05020 [Campylobacter sp.]|nr:hypothetical protein [Campylobacter sp.]
MNDLDKMMPILNKTSYKFHVTNRKDINAPYIKNYDHMLPLINKMVFQKLRGNYYWSSNYIYRPKYGLINISIYSCNPKKEKPTGVLDTRFHKIEVFADNCYEVTYK